MTTIAPHLHRVETVNEAVHVGKEIVLSAAPLLTDFVTNCLGSLILIGPDEESVQWIAGAATRHRFENAGYKKVSAVSAKWM